jgi:hypothetical protein
MSVKIMDEVLSRLFLDKEFRQLLRHNPEHALAGYDLTPKERAALSKLRKRRTPLPRKMIKAAPFPKNSDHSFSLN